MQRAKGKVQKARRGGGGSPRLPVERQVGRDEGLGVDVLEEREVK